MTQAPSRFVGVSIQYRVWHLRPNQRNEVCMVLTRSRSSELLAFFLLMKWCVSGLQMRHYMISIFLYNGSSTISHSSEAIHLKWLYQENQQVMNKQPQFCWFTVNWGVFFSPRRWVCDAPIHGFWRNSRNSIIWQSMRHNFLLLSFFLFIVCWRRTSQVIASSPYLPMQYGYADSVPSQNYYSFAARAGCYDGTSEPATTPVFECLVSKDSVTLQNASYTVRDRKSVV